MSGDVAAKGRVELKVTYVALFEVINVVYALVFYTVGLVYPFEYKSY